jgi:adenine-specific DNA-methyltransferase
MQLYETLEQQLKKEPNYVTDDGELKKWVVLNKAQNYDEELIELLMQNDVLKEKFFVKVKDVLVFKQNLFLDFLEQKNYLNDSYTRYKNKIGLTIDGKFLKQRNEVALVWPFKDCILEGGQSREEQKREEIFFNEILAQDEITQLLEPKVLTNAKRINKDGEHPFTGFTRDAELNRKRGLPEDTITDNLIIKGNNLLALHSLKKEFAGKVKLIYIDPPYNPPSQNNTFAYNNNFNHSSWLTFTKNRLEVGKKLLKEDGAYIIAIDENEVHYLGVLIDEVFSTYENHCITIVHNPRGVQGTNFSYTHEYAFFIFPKGKKIIGNRLVPENEIDFSNLRNWGGESLREDAKNCFYPIIVNPNTSEIIGFGDVCEDDFHPETRAVEEGNNILVYPIDNSGVERKWRYARQTVESIKNLLRARIKSGQWDIEIGKNFGQYKTVWIDPRYDANEYGTKIVSELVPENKFSFPKSLYNVKDCIHAVVGEDKNAIVLDYHAGSGTTAHAVLELNKEDGGKRQFILIEQMDYVESITSQRVQKVFEKDNLEDSFTYLELKKYNQTFMEQIEAADDTETLLQIWKQLKAKSFFKYSIDLQAFENSLDEFKQFDLKRQKEILCEILDKNQLYVNLSSLNDADFACTEEEKKVTQDFYQLKK